ncbi:MAG: glycosyltransferase [Bacteroidota bacterium]
MKNKVLYILSLIPIIKRVVNLYRHRNDLFAENKVLKKQISEFHTVNVLGINSILQKLILKSTSKDQLDDSILKVVHICAGDFGGGGNLLALNLHEKLLKRGIDSKMIVGKKKTNSSLIDSFKENDGLNSWYREISNDAKAEGFIDLLNLEAFNLINHPWIKDATVIHIHNIHGDFFSWYALPFICNNKKVVWTLHDLYAFTGHCGYAFDCVKWQTDCYPCSNLEMYPFIQKDTAMALLEIKKTVYKKINPVFISPSDWQLNNTSKSIVKEFLNKRIYNGIDTSSFNTTPKIDIRALLNLPTDKKILIYVGNLGMDNPFKGTEYILNLIKWVDKREDYFFLIIGGVDDYNKGNVQYISYKSSKVELANYLSAATVFIMPSLQEVFGLVAVESMACGTPVVGFNVGGIPEIIEHKVNGYVSNYKDFDDLINGIEYISNLLEADYQLMVKNAIETVRSRFSLDLMVDEYVGVYGELTVDNGQLTIDNGKLIMDNA